MLPPPRLYPLHMHLPVEISGVLPAPLLLTGPLAGCLTVRLRTEPLVVDVARMRPEPKPTMTTLPQSFCAHRFLPKQDREEYDKPCRAGWPFTRPNTRAGLPTHTAKKEEDDPFGSRRKEKKSDLSDRLKKSHFKTASRAWQEGNAVGGAIQERVDTGQTGRSGICGGIH